MNAAKKRQVAVPFSERTPVSGARVVGDVDPAERIGATIYVRRNPHSPSLPDVNESTGPTAPLSDAAFLSSYGADPADIKKVTDAVTEAGLEVVRSSVEKRSVEIVGPAESVEAFFGVKLQRFEAAGGEYRGRTGSVKISADLAPVVEAVFGLDDRKVGSARLRRDPRAAFGVATVQRLDIVRANGLPPQTYLPTTLSSIYRFPPGTDGSGQCVAILCFNDSTSHGGYSRAALEIYFGQVLQTPMPQLVDVVVHGQGNDPGDDSGADPADSSAEVMLDIQMIGGCAPKAKLVAYFSQFTEQGWVDLINTIITDTTNKPTVISCSYGNPEDDPRSAWTLAAIRKVNEAFNAAALRGITICCASGDDGSRDQAGDGRAHTDFPASSPYVLGCGGTRLMITPSGYPWESVWNDGPGSATGGGVSKFFPLPSWQRLVGVPPSANPDHHVGRGVPDVSGVADPQTGVVIITLDGQHLAVIGGTSATAPMWSALIARLNQALGKPLGFFNPTLYGALAHGVLRDVFYGNNGAYAARPGWDACTGMGSPDGVNLLAALTAIGARTAYGSTPEPANVLEPFRSAYETFVGALATARSAVDSEGIDVFSERASHAYATYLTAVKQSWHDLNASAVDTPSLYAIGQSLASAAAQTTMAAMSSAVASPSIGDMRWKPRIV
jgi:kumamolisin